MLYFIIGILYFCVGWKAREIHAVMHVKKLILSQQENQVNDKTIIKLEMHSDIIYAYREDTNEFLGQSDTLDELSKVLNQRFPNQTFAARPQNLKDLGLYHE